MSEIPKFSINELVEKLIGKIKPIGDTNIDEVRYSNLKKHIMLTEDMVLELSKVAGAFHNDYLASRKKASNKSVQALKDLKGMIDDTLESLEGDDE